MRPKQHRHKPHKSGPVNAEPAATKRRMSFKDKHALDTLPKTIAALRAEADALQARLDDPNSTRGTAPPSRKPLLRLGACNSTSPRRRSNGWNSKSCVRNSLAPT